MTFGLMPELMPTTKNKRVRKVALNKDFPYVEPLSRGAASCVVFHDLINPCPTSSLTLSHVEKQGDR